MIKVQWQAPQTLAEVQAAVQTAIDLEFSTLPPYLYAKMTILPESNPAALARLNTIVGQEMIHMCLACNIMNAIGGTVKINPPSYPGPLPGDIGGGLIIHLLPFSQAAMAQGMAIEEPSEPIDPPILKMEAAITAVTIGEYYHLLDQVLAALPASAWIAGNKQIDDSQFFAGQIFPVNAYADAHKAITQIVSEGEGTPVSPNGNGSPLTFQNELAHYYRFWEMEQNMVLVKDPNPVGYAWKGSLGIDWSQVYPAIADPESHDFSSDPPAARAAQTACNDAYTALVDALTSAFAGASAGMGIAVRAMFDLRMASIQALNTPLGDGISVAGPAFVYNAHTQAQGDAA
ncbi:MAG: ferritin-like protein [Xanthomonadaceae bacterium]|nr:ferritin-like protein [Xanthomonadaceae bacterium]